MKVYTNRTFKAKFCKDFWGNNYTDFQYYILINDLCPLKLLRKSSRIFQLGITFDLQAEFGYMQLCMRENLYNQKKEVDKDGLKGFGHSRKIKIGSASNLAV